jgi:hypothetical protein
LHAHAEGSATGEQLRKTTTPTSAAGSEAGKRSLKDHRNSVAGGRSKSGSALALMALLMLLCGYNHASAALLLFCSLISDLLVTVLHFSLFSHLHLSHAHIGKASVMQGRKTAVQSTMKGKRRLVQSKMSE